MVVFIAAFAVPSVVMAHDGHAHHRAPVVAKATASSPDVTPSMNIPVTRAGEEVISIFTVGPLSEAPNAPANCGGRCCGGITGMACCGVALAPNPFEICPILRFVPCVFKQALPAHGLPPEALPKPPKFFA